MLCQQFSNGVYSMHACRRVWLHSVRHGHALGVSMYGAKFGNLAASNICIHLMPLTIPRLGFLTG